MVQSKHVVVPAILFAAGSFAGSANATVFVTDVDLSAGSGSKLAIGVPTADAQFSFPAKAPLLPALVGNGTAGVNFEGDLSSTPVIPDGSASFSSLVKTSSSGGYYGLRFDVGADTYYGWAQVDDGGSHLSKVAYDAPTELGVTTSVPEAATWAEMILGLGLVGAATRRRRQQAAALSA